MAHISDIHLGPLPKATVLQLMSKRMTGYINWHANRANPLGGDVLAALIRSLKATQPDHIAVTGDLMNIGLLEEIENTGRWLEALGAAEMVSVVPGNHDAYVRGILEQALTRWAPYVTGDDGQAAQANAGFPYLRVRGPLAVIGVNSAVATAPFLATGRVTADQCSRLQAVLENTRKQGLFRVVMIHHPPVGDAAKPRKRLLGIGLFQQAIASGGAELVLHGHTHLPQRHIIPGLEDSKVPVIGVPSASQALGGKKPPSAFNLFDIDGSSQTGWRCELTQHSLVQMTAPYEPQIKEQLY